MKSFFSEEGARVLEQWGKASHVAVFDFDGTLAPIVDIPSQAKMSVAVSQALRDLMKTVPVVIISGRGGNDLRERLGDLNPKWVGNHGLEGIEIRAEALKMAKMIHRAWVNQLRDFDFGAGIKLEDKKFSLTLHYRSVKYRSYAKKKILRKVQTLDPPPRIVLGKSVVNLIPPGMPHKGDALLSIMARLKADRAVFFGDDVTDEDVFALNDSRVMGVRIGRKQGTSADFFLRHQSDMARAIRALAQSASRRKTAK